MITSHVLSKFLDEIDPRTVDYRHIFLAAGYEKEGSNGKLWAGRVEAHFKGVL